MTEAANRGRIVTFYSYKGGTGRSMALANVAWILASNGMRVLVIDWDLEGPGVHRYFQPFLTDKNLNNTDGLIDFVLDFEAAAKTTEEQPPSNPEWFLAYTNLLRYAASLNSDVFLKPGTLDFVSAGRQDAGYSIRVNGFNWRDFYENLGGGILLEAVKEQLRRDYDYILIDSRTGVSDTSGICTVQMPDDLIVCFTLSNQSLDGAAVAAGSALMQRTAKDGQATLRVWPVPMRIETGEKDRLEIARDFIREKFAPFLIHIPPQERDEYWGRVEVPYQPFYAYEEVLSTFRDRPSDPKSVLASMEAVVDYLTEGRIAKLRRIPETKRTELLSLYLRPDRRIGPQRAATLVTLSENLRLQGDIVGARKALAEAVGMLSEQLGANHTETLSARDKLASLLLLAGDYRAARTAYEGLLESRRKANGPDHPETIACMNNLATALVALGELSAARELQQGALDLYERVLGARHPAIDVSKTGSELTAYRAMWKTSLKNSADVVLDYPGWPASGLAVMGDFSGIQTFVFRPVPGAGGAARRLRSRSFRVSAYSEMIMRWCVQMLAEGQPRVLYVAGGKFLMALSTFSGWDSKLDEMRADLDAWAWHEFGGEIIFNLAAVPFERGIVPLIDLHEAITNSRIQPLASFLISQEGWSVGAFFHPAASGDGKCDACGSTRRLTTAIEDEALCDDCIQDEQIGKDLPRSRYARLSPRARNDVSFLGTNMELCSTQTILGDSEWLAFEGEDAKNARHWYLLRHLPTDAGKTLTFDRLANASVGSKKWLGYLRIDADGAGRHFRELKGNPQRIWALSRFLNGFFAETANRLISSRFQKVYSVFGGGDDLFVVGPWNDLLDFAHALRAELRSLAGDDLTFSAGLSLGKPKEHILTQANLALRELESAKKTPGHGRRVVGRDQIRALGVTVDWDTFSKLLPAAREVTEWARAKQIPSSFLHEISRLHHYWDEQITRSKGRVTASAARYKPLLYYQIQRNLRLGRPREWAEGLLQADSLWPWANFIVRYAMLAAKPGTDKE